MCLIFEPTLSGVNILCSFLKARQCVHCTCTLHTGTHSIHGKHDYELIKLQYICKTFAPTIHLTWVAKLWLLIAPEKCQHSLSTLFRFLPAMNKPFITSQLYWEKWWKLHSTNHLSKVHPWVPKQQARPRPSPWWEWGFCLVHITLSSKWHMTKCSKGAFYNHQEPKDAWGHWHRGGW